MGCVEAGACFYAGNAGSIGRIKNSCYGVEACREMAADGGSIDNIENSCNFIGGDDEDGTVCKSCVCYGAASTGKITSIINSCNSAKHACYYAGANGNIKSLSGSCNNG